MKTARLCRLLTNLQIAQVIITIYTTLDLRAGESAQQVTSLQRDFLLVEGLYVSNSQETSLVLGLENTSGSDREDLILCVHV